MAPSSAIALSNCSVRSAARAGSNGSFVTTRLAGAAVADRPMTQHSTAIGARARRKVSIRKRSSSYGAVLGFDLDTNGFQEIIRQDAAGADDHRIVAQFQLLAGLLQDHILGA